MKWRRTKFDKEKYETLLSAYRELGSHRKVGKKLGISEKTCWKYFHYGNPHYDWARPLKEVLEDEAKLARERLAKDQEFRALRNREQHVEERMTIELDREAIRRDAIAARAEEAKLVRAARSGGLQVLAALLRMGPGVQKISERMSTELALLAAKEGLNVRQALGVIRSYTLAVREANTAASQAMEMERLYLGEPTEIIGFADAGVGEMSLEECQAEIEAAQAAMGRAQANGLIVMDGGKKGRD